MKSKMNLKSIVFIAVIGIISLFFINMSLAANSAKVIVETANLRETADTNGKILVQISEGQEVEILEEAGEWYKIKYNNITGYLRADLLDVSTENTNTAETNTQVEENTEIQNQETDTTEATEPETTSTTTEIQKGTNYIKEDVKLKIVPVINATNTIEVKKGQEIEVTEIINGWVCIECQNTKGWVRKEKIQTLAEKQQEEEAAKKLEEEKKAQEEAEKKAAEQKAAEQNAKTVTKYINSNTVNLRKEASKSSEIVASLSLNTAVEVVSEDGGWAKVKVNGKEGYIASTLLSSTKQETSRSSTTRTQETSQTQQSTTSETTTSASGTGSEVVAYAKQFIGTKYVYGGTSPSTGFDCSGFTAYVYKKFGVSLPHSSSAQGQMGTAVSKDNLAAGDLVIYSGHVAIYVGGGQVIHAPRPGKTVCIVPLSQAASNYIGARRIL